MADELKNHLRPFASDLGRAGSSTPRDAVRAGGTGSSADDDSGDRVDLDAADPAAHLRARRPQVCDPAATIRAISQLPEPAQHKQMELEAERTKREIDLAKYHIDVEAAARKDARAHEQLNAVREYRYMVGVSAALIAMVAYLFYRDQLLAAASIAVGLGGTWLRGTGPGGRKAGRAERPYQTRRE